MEDQKSSGQSELPSVPVMAVSICFNIINHVLIGFVATYITLIAIDDELKAMNWHAWSCTIGFQVLMLEGIMMFYSENVWSSQMNKQTKRCVHWIIQAVGSSLVLSGVLVKFVDNNDQHFRSTHSVIGLISAIFIFISIGIGVFALKSFSLRNILRPASVKLLHYIVGIVTIVLGLVALCYGYDKKFMKANSDENILFYLHLIAVSTAIFSLIGALQSIYLGAKANFLQ